MARLHLDGLGSHPLRHETFEVRIDGAVLGRDGVVAWLRSPGCVRGLSGEERFLKWLLHRIEHLCFCPRKVAREIAQESLFGKTSLIAVEHDSGRCWRRGIGLGQGR